MKSKQYYNTLEGRKIMRRNLKILKKFQSGVTKYKLAKQYKLSATRIRQIINFLS